MTQPAEYPSDEWHSTERASSLLTHQPSLSARDSSAHCSVWPSLNSWPKRLLLVAIVLLACWLRLPRINEGLPFFTREDEAHHFNRLAEMMKEGRLDPQYFHKPSLHFYLRMPVFAGSFLWGVREGHIRSIQDVTTRDKFGVAGYSFSASHPGIVKGSRLLTVALGILTLLLSISITWRLSRSLSATLLAGLLIATSPPLVSEGAIIGVDILMMLMSVWCVWIALCSHRRGSQELDSQKRNVLLPLLGCGLVAGLAISSKYNAAPIVLVPIAWCLLSYGPHLKNLALVCASIVFGFLVATPFSLAHIPQFLDQVAYEIWHYGVVGHEGHMTTPGSAQFMFYLEWLSFQALGPVATALGLLGMLTFFRRPFQPNLLFIIFPLVFFGLMLSQKTNFTRNMLVFLPFMCISAAVALHHCIQWLQLGERPRKVVLGVAALLCAVFPFWRSLTERAEAVSFVESRAQFLNRLPQIEQSSPFEQIAIAGQLQLPVSTFSIGPRARFNQGNESLVALYQKGFSKFVISQALGINSTEQALFQETERFEGDKKTQRIIANPEISILVPSEGAALTAALEQHAKASGGYSLQIKLADPTSKNCATTTEPGTTGSATPESASGDDHSEEYCWLAGRASYLELTDFSSALRAPLNSEFISLGLELMSPWSENSVSFSNGAWQQQTALPSGEWTPVTLQVPLKDLLASPTLLAKVAIVRSPRLQGLSQDPRPLGVAVRNIRLR